MATDDARENVEHGTCSCGRTRFPDEVWTDKGEVPPPVEERGWFVDWDPACPRHGEGTDHHRHIQARARELAERLGLLDFQQGGRDVMTPFSHIEDLS